MASTISVTRRYMWIIQNLTRVRMENPSFVLTSESIFIDLEGTKTEWSVKIKLFFARNFMFFCRKFKISELEENGIFYMCFRLTKIGVMRDNFQVSFALKMGDCEAKFTKLSKDIGGGGRNDWVKLITTQELFDPFSVYFNENSQLHISLKVNYNCAFY